MSICCNSKQSELMVDSGRDFATSTHNSALNWETFSCIFWQFENLFEHQKRVQFMIVGEDDCGFSVDLPRDFPRDWERRNTIIRVPSWRYLSTELPMQRHLRRDRAAVVVQRWYKSVQNRLSFLSLREACLFVQDRWRYLSNRRRIIKCQAAVRRFISKRFCAKIRSCIKIQALARMWLVYRRFRTLKRVVVGYIARWRYCRQRQSCIRIQSFLRMASVQKRIRLISHVFAGYLQRKRFLKTRTACIKIQSIARMYLERRKYQLLMEEREREREHAATLLELAKKQENADLSTAACIKIQSTIRMHLARRKYRSLLEERSREEAKLQIDASLDEFKAESENVDLCTAAVTKDTLMAQPCQALAVETSSPVCSSPRKRAISAMEGGSLPSPNKRTAYTKSLIALKISPRRSKLLAMALKSPGKSKLSNEIAKPAIKADASNQLLKSPAKFAFSSQAHQSPKPTLSRLPSKSPGKFAGSSQAQRIEKSSLSGMPARSPAKLPPPRLTPKSPARPAVSTLAQKSPKLSTIPANALMSPKPSNASRLVLDATPNGANIRSTLAASKSTGIPIPASVSKPSNFYSKSSTKSQISALLAKSPLLKSFQSTVLAPNDKPVHLPKSNDNILHLPVSNDKILHLPTNKPLSSVKPIHRSNTKRNTLNTQQTQDPIKLDASKSTEQTPTNDVVDAVDSKPAPQLMRVYWLTQPRLRSSAVSMAEKVKRLEEIQRKKDALKSQLQSTKTPDAPPAKRPPSLTNLTYANTKKNAGYKHVHLSRKNVHVSGPAPPSPTTLLEYKMANRVGIRTFVSTEPEGQTSKLKWDSSLISFFPVASPGSYMPRTLAMQEARKSCLKASGSSQLPSEPEAIVVSKYCYDADSAEPEAGTLKRKK